jgi:hypothetical protein
MALRYLNPLWWGYALTLKPLWWCVTTALKAPLWALRKTKPKSFLGKLLWYPAAIWILIPGTVPLSYYWMYAQLTGNTEQFDALWNGFITTAKLAYAVGMATYQVLY